MLLVSVLFCWSPESVALSKICFLVNAKYLANNANVVVTQDLVGHNTFALQAACLVNKRKGNFFV